MSEEKRPCITICRGVNVRFQARVRYAGSRKYILLGKSTCSQRKALRELADAFATGRYKRGDVLMAAEYYDPTPICEIVRL